MHYSVYDIAKSVTKNQTHLEAIKKLETYEGTLFTDKEYTSLLARETIREWAGRCNEWFHIEIIVFWAYVFTLAILMIKSRFTRIGIDSSHQFKPFYMSCMANEVVKAMNVQSDAKAIKAYPWIRH